MHRLCPDSPTLVLGNQGALAYLSDDEIIDVVSPALRKQCFS